MVVRVPPADEWLVVEDSTLVREIAFDEAAERIFVRWKPQGMLVFENCSVETWDLFRVPGTSKGAYVLHVLSRHPHTRL